MADSGDNAAAFQRRGFSNEQGGGTDWHPADGERLTKDELAVLLERAAECDERSTNTSFQRVRRTIRTTELNDLLEFVDADFQERVFAGARRWPITRRLQAMRDAIDTYVPHGRRRERRGQGGRRRRRAPPDQGVGGLPARHGRRGGAGDTAHGRARRREGPR